MYYKQDTALAVYAQRQFGGGHCKTAEGVIRYGRNPVVAVIDSRLAGKRVQDVMSFPCQAPIVASVEDCLPFKPGALLLGTAWSGGHLPDEWRPDIICALESGMDVINGLHDFLSDDPEISEVARRHGRALIDVRKPPQHLPVASGLALQVPAFVVLTVGSDCAVGKMTASLELLAACHRRGHTGTFVATGQTGIMIAGHGIAVDRVVGDFMAGAAERLVVEAAPGHDFVFVEGQGSLTHPGFSGVTLSLLHGSCPQALVLCHKATRRWIGDGEDGSIPFAVRPLSELVDLYEQMASYMRPAKVICIAINTSGLSDSEAREVINRAQRETGLPASDPVRFGCDSLFDALLRAKELQRVGECKVRH